MATENKTELAEFYEFVGRQVAAGSKVSPEVALDMWRDSNPFDEEDVITAVREALDDVAAGDQGIPADEFFRQFRAEHGLS